MNDKPKVTGQSLQRLMILLLIMSLFNTILLGASIFYQSFMAPVKVERITEIERLEFLTEYGINQRIKEIIKSGKEEEMYRFYDTFTGNRSVSYTLVATSLLYDIPTHYMFGLAWTESRFFPTAENKEKNKDGSVDYGLMQLNSNTFKQYKKETLLDLTTNVRIAAEFVLKQYQRYNNWYETFMGYNGGNTELVKNPTINHMVSVLEYSKKLDVEFSRKF